MIYFAISSFILFIISLFVAVIATKKGLKQMEMNEALLQKIEQSLVTLRHAQNIINKASRTDVAFNDPVVRGVIKAVNLSKVSLENIIKTLELELNDTENEKKDSTKTY